MKYVHVVSEYYDYQNHVLGAFLSEKQALAFKNKRKKQYPHIQVTIKSIILLDEEE